MSVRPSLSGTTSKSGRHSFVSGFAAASLASSITMVLSRATWTARSLLRSYAVNFRMTLTWRKTNWKCFNFWGTLQESSHEFVFILLVPLCSVRTTCLRVCGRPCSRPLMRSVTVSNKSLTLRQLPDDMYYSTHFICYMKTSSALIVRDWCTWCKFRTVMELPHHFPCLLLFNHSFGLPKKLLEKWLGKSTFSSL